jgi:hypothetical protein
VKEGEAIPAESGETCRHVLKFGSDFEIECPRIGKD